METDVVKFSGANLACIKDGNMIWVAIKPVCEALGLDAKNQYEQILGDEVLGQLVGEHPLVAADGKTRTMYCLPLDFINGWLFQIKFTNTMSEETKQNLLTYKRECYRVLANHFFGNMRRQIEVNTMEISLLEEINQLNEQKNELTNVLRQKKSKLDKIRELRLKPDPELEFN